MSLLTTASVWTNDESKPPNKKRIPTMRNAILPPHQQQQQQAKPVLETDASPDEVPVGIQELQAAAAKQSSRIHQLLNNMSVDNDGQNLANFEPLDHPVIQKRSEDGEATSHALDMPVQLRPVDAPFQPSAASYHPNYHVVYEPPTRLPPPLPHVSSLPQDPRWMEKINYMIYLLEQQQNEKTNHITEEFVLYTFLGVFIIFVVDAFSRGGKYVR
jgi:hypothetical protein